MMNGLSIRTSSPHESSADACGVDTLIRCEKNRRPGLAMIPVVGAFDRFTSSARAHTSGNRRITERAGKRAAHNGATNLI